MVTLTLQEDYKTYSEFGGPGMSEFQTAHYFLSGDLSKESVSLYATISAHRSYQREINTCEDPITGEERTYTTKSPDFYGEWSVSRPQRYDKSKLWFLAEGEKEWLKYN